MRYFSNECLFILLLNVVINIEEMITSTGVSDTTSGRLSLTSPTVTSMKDLVEVALLPLVDGQQSTLSW